MNRPTALPSTVQRITMPAFDKFPRQPTIPVERYKVAVPQAQIDDLHARLEHQAPRKATWDNTNGPFHLGVKKSWLDDYITKWKRFDWCVVHHR